MLYAQNVHYSEVAPGFTHGIYEDFNGTDRDHWHFQIGIGNGLDESHSLNNPQIFIKKY